MVGFVGSVKAKFIPTLLNSVLCDKFVKYMVQKGMILIILCATASKQSRDAHKVFSPA